MCSTVSCLEPAGEPGAARRELFAPRGVVDLRVILGQQALEVPVLEDPADRRGQGRGRAQPAIEDETAPVTSGIQPIGHARVCVRHYAAELPISINMSLLE